MTRSNCDPCCNPTELARNESSWRDAVLQVLCDISAGGGGGGGDLLGIYNVTPPILTDGEEQQLQLDVAGNLRVYLASLLFGENDTVSTPGTNVGTLGVTPNYAYSTRYSPASELQQGLVSRTVVTAANKNILVSYSVQNTTASLVYFQVWNGATVGAGTLVDYIPVPSGTATVPGFSSKGTTDFGANGLFCNVGISWGFSTTPVTYSAVGAGTGLTVQLFYLTA